jgi:uncharacterized membrane protein
MERQTGRESWASLLLPFALVLGLVLLLGLEPGDAASATEVTNPLEAPLKTIVGYLVALAEIAAAVVIGLAVLRAIGRYVLQQFGRSSDHENSPESIRLRMGRALALGLEFTVASDILRTAVAPTRRDILTLGAIVMLRTLLNYFLEREIRQGEDRGVPGRPPDNREAGQAPQRE